MFDDRQTKAEIIDGGMKLHAQLVDALAEVERLRAAGRILLELWDDEPVPDDTPYVSWSKLTFGDLRKAAAAIGEQGGQQQP